MPKEVRQFLAAANGQKNPTLNDDYDIVIPRLRFGKKPDQLTAEGWLLDVEEIVRSTLFQREYFRDKLPKTKRWGPIQTQSGMIILTGAETPWYLAADMSPAEGGHVGQIVSVSDYPEQYVVIADNLSHMFEILIAGYRDERYAFDDDGYWSEQGHT